MQPASAFRGGGTCYPCLINFVTDGIKKSLKEYFRDFSVQADTQPAFFVIAFTASNSSVISLSGAFVARETTTMNTQATINAGRSS